MQRRRSAFEPFPDEPLDLNQGSDSNTMDESAVIRYFLPPPMERRLLNNDLSNELNFGRSLSGWEYGESSSRGSLNDDGLTSGTRDLGLSEKQQDLQSAEPTRNPMNVNLNIGYEDSSTSDDEDGTGFMDYHGSCKRKALEGSSAQPRVASSPVSPRAYNGPMNRYETPLVPESTPSHLGPNRRRPNVSSSADHQSNRQILLNEFLDHANNSSNPQPLLMPVPSLPRTTPHFLWGNNTGSSSNVLRNNMVQDPTNWSLATGNESSSDGPSFFNAMRSTPSRQRSFDLPPWNLFPSADPESGNRRNQFPPFPGGSGSGSGSSTSEDYRISSGPSSQRHQRQSFPGDDWRVLDSDMDGRQRMVSEIRQVLQAMRRGGNLRAEDHVLFDPFINGLAELHDRHREMRLDVDNMSYEELLALEERIGDVKTGLSEEVILMSMSQRRHRASRATSTQVLEPCCICQEEYEIGDDIGSLDCGHDFHTNCVLQWLTQKNVCPICKMTGIAT